MDLNFIKKIYLFLTFLFLFGFSFSFNNSKSELIYNHLNTKYQNLSISEQQEKRRGIKSIFFKVKRKTKTNNLGLEELVMELIQKADRKINALEDFKNAYYGDKIFEINLGNNVVIFTKDPSLLQTRNNSERSIQKDITSDLNSIRNNILKLVNQEREKKGFGLLEIDQSLNQAAQGHAKYMSDTKDFNHTTKEGLEFHQRIKAAGYKGGIMGENIAYNQRSEKTVMEAWMNSSGHKENILDSDFTKIGIGFYNYYWVQNFGG